MFANLVLPRFPITTNDVLRCMGDSDFKFYLTGSRFFGTMTEKSDYDFFIYDTVEVRAFLESLSFRKSNSLYKDSTVQAVYRRCSVDVQLVNSLIIKLKAQELIKKYGLFVPNKIMMKAVWDMVLDALGGKN